MQHDREKIYHEYLAKIVLENLFPQQYNELQLKDSPDLINASGDSVEVTRAFLYGDAEASHLFSKACGKALDDISVRDKERLSQLGQQLIVYHGKVVAEGPIEAFWETTSELEKAVNKKIGKLSNYKGATSLFIFAPLFDSYNVDMIQEFTM